MTSCLLSGQIDMLVDKIKQVFQLIIEIFVIWSLVVFLKCKKNKELIISPRQNIYMVSEYFQYRKYA